MYAIDEGMKRINGELVDTWSREVSETVSRLEVEAGTTGYKGGIRRDAGGRTYISIRALEGDFWFSTVTDGKGNAAGVEIAACGDTGLNALVKALDFARDVLNDQRCGVSD